MIPGIVWYVVFCYLPMGGLSLAFKTLKANLGIWQSPWVGLLNYQFVFSDPDFFNAMKNTLLISTLRLLIEFPFPIILALLLNEVRVKRYQKILQTVYTFPNFLSWIIVAGIMNNVFAYDGLINGVLASLGGGRTSFLSNGTSMFWLLFPISIWKSAGWSCIIYLCAIAGIDTSQYEAAVVDGASRSQQMIYITLPSLLPTISVLFILQVGNLMNAGFDQIFNMGNAAVSKSIDVLDTYIYNITFRSTRTDFGFSTAISLMKSLINFFLIFAANMASSRLNGNGLFS